MILIAGIIKVKNVYPNKKVRHTMRLYQDGSIWIMTKKMTPCSLILP